MIQAGAMLRILIKRFTRGNIILDESSVPVSEILQADNNLSDLSSVVTARNNLLPSKVGNALKFLRINSGATDFEWAAGGGGGGVSDGDYGDVTVSGTGTVWTIDNDVVTNAKSANMATQTIKGRNTAGTGDPEDLAIATVKTMLALVKADVGLGSVVNADTTTTANITDSTNKRFITDAQQTVLSNTSGTNSGNETTATTGALINGATGKTTPVDADFIGLMDSAASNILKKLSWLNIKATLKTYFDTLYPSGSGTSSGTNTGDNSANSSSQPVNSNLTTIAGLTATTDNFIVSVASAWASRTPSQVRTTLALVIGTNVQAWDADLDAIAGLTATTNNFIVSASSAWASRTPAQVKVTLSLDNVENTALSTWAGTANITILGTIATGTWNATAIADSKIASALTGKTYNGVTLTTAGSATKYLNEQGNYVTITGGTGDVVGPASSVNNRVVFFSGTTGKLIADSGLTLSGSNTGDQTISLTGDATATGGTGALSVTVVKINGTTLSALATGILKNTTGTGAPSIAIAADFPTLNQSTSGTAANLSGTPALPNGTTATTQSANDNSTKLATTAYADTKAPIASPVFTGKVTVPTGVIGSAPYNIPSGTLATSPNAGDWEFDGTSHYASVDTSSGRGMVPVEQRFRLTAAGSTIGVIANYFGTTSNISLVANAEYEIEIFLFFLKTTAGTVTWTLTNSVAPTSQNIYFSMSPITGIVAPPGTATELCGQYYNDTTAARAFTTGTLTTAVNHYAYFKIFLRNSTGTSLKIQATVTGGTITPGIGSRWIARRLPVGNTGTFAA